MCQAPFDQVCRIRPPGISYYRWRKNVGVSLEEISNFFVTYDELTYLTHNMPPNF